MLCIPCLYREHFCEELLSLPRMSPLVDLPWLEKKRAGVQVDLAAPSPFATAPSQM